MLGPQPHKPHFCFASCSLLASANQVLEGDWNTGGAEGMWASLLPSCRLLVCWWSSWVSPQHHFFTPSVAVSFIAAANPVCSFCKTWRTSLVTSIPSSWDTTTCWPRVWVPTSQAPFSDLGDTSTWPASLPSEHQNPLSNLWSFKNLNLFLSFP